MSKHPTLKVDRAMAAAVLAAQLRAVHTAVFYSPLTLETERPFRAALDAMLRELAEMECA